MFFKMSKLKKLLKSAYKGGCLIVGHAAESEDTEEGIYLSSGWWIMWFSCATMEKEIKAAIIELCGDLPAQGEVFRASEGGNQYEIEQKEAFNLPAQFTRNTAEYRMTKVILKTWEGDARVLQHENRDVFLIRDCIIDMIDTKGLRETESQPIGPVMPEGINAVGWYNYDYYLTAYPISQDEKHADFTMLLTTVELP